MIFYVVGCAVFYVGAYKLGDYLGFIRPFVMLCVLFEEFLLHWDI